MCDIVTDIARQDSDKPWRSNNPDPHDINISDAIAAFLTYMKACGRRPLTISSYNSSLGLLVSAFGAAPLRSINEFGIDRLVAGLVDGQHGVAPRRPATMNRIVSTFKTFFNWAFHRGLVDVNPAVGIKSARGASTPTLAFTRQETAAFMIAISTSGDRLALRDMALFGIYIYTGIRRCEALDLRAGDFDSGRRELRIRFTKGGVPATRHVPHPLAAILTAHIQALNSCQDTEVPDFLFPGTRPERHMTARQAHARFNHWKTGSGIRPGLTIHSFRAGFATLLHQATGDALLVSRALGHADIRTTGRYVASDTDGLRRAIDGLFGAMIRPSPTGQPAQE